MSKRLAVLADIHGSLPALEAVLADLGQFSIGGMIVAGDMVAGPNSVEVLQRLQELGAWMVRGNNEDYLLRFESGEAPDWWYTAHQWGFIRWVYAHVGHDTLALVRSLPAQRVIALPGRDPIRVVHGSLQNAGEHLYPGYGGAALERAKEQTTEPVLICGHTHIPWQERQDGLLAFNPGAVCWPLNGFAGAQYALLEWGDGQWELELRSIEYDLNLAVKAFEDSGLMEAGGAFSRGCVMGIQTGRNVLVKFGEYAYHLAAEAGFPDCEYVPDEIWDRAARTFDWEDKKK